jgi:hypothetical protein
VANPANPQYFNRYSYVLNNPLKYTDPTGQYIHCGDPQEGRNLVNTKQEKERLEKAIETLKDAPLTGNLVWYLHYQSATDLDINIRYANINDWGEINPNRTAYPYGDIIPNQWVITIKREIPDNLFLPKIVHELVHAFQLHNGAIQDPQTKEEWEEFYHNEWEAYKWEYAYYQYMEVEAPYAVKVIGSCDYTDPSQRMLAKAMLEHLGY